jgi:hypothetical protein
MLQEHMELMREMMGHMMTEHHLMLQDMGIEGMGK